MYIMKMLKLFHFYIFFNSFLGKVLCQELYVGCYNNFNGTQPNTNHIQSVSQCLTDCKSRTSYFIAIKDGSSCYCGNITNTRVPSSNCNLTCGDNNDICGGNNFYAVYTDVPTYQGCFNDQDTRDIENCLIDGDGTLTIDKCYELCLKNKYDFMGVQHGSCFCGQQYGKYGRGLESDCNRNCYGDIRQICGGHWRNSVYSIGYLQGLNKSYSEVFHCLNGATDMHGTCTDVTCQPGWKGTKCNQRDCMLNNGNCGQHKCEEITIGNKIISECVCKQGFQSISIYDECTDVDECTQNVCNITTSICSNTIGSFDCICKEGFVKIPLNQSYNGECYNKLHELTSFSQEGNVAPGKRDIVILGTFLSFLICSQIIFISAVLFYRTSGKNVFNSSISSFGKIKKLTNIIQSTGAKTADSTYKQLDFSIQSLDDHNYSELANNSFKK